MGSKALRIISTVIALILVLCGCDVKTVLPQESNVPSITLAEDSVLWIVTEETVPDGMNSQAQSIIELLHEQYPQVQFKLDILPTAELERKTYLQQIRQEISDGAGPDIFLLPTSNLQMLDKPVRYTYQRVEPLFQDVVKAMRQGVFYDISYLYDRDFALEKEMLEQTVMDCGVQNGARYVLPIRYNIPIFYIEKAELEMPEDVLLAGITDIMQYAIDRNDKLVACGAEYPSLNAFSQIVDYEQNKVALSAEEISQYMEQFQKMEEIIGSEISHRSARDITGYLFGKEKNYPMSLAKLGNSLEYLAIAKAQRCELIMHPVRTSRGEVIADVTYYAAIGANCSMPYIAYSFIRMFLLENAQWEQDRPTGHLERSPGLIENSWPVRNKGATKKLWENYKLQFMMNYEISGAFEERKQSIQNVSLTDMDIPFWALTPDTVRFPIVLKNRFDVVLSNLNDGKTCGTPVNVDLDKLASDYLSSLNTELCG